MRWDVRFEVDAHQYRYGFDKKAWADEFADKLQEGFTKRWLFDPTARCFVAPIEQNAEPPSPTFAEYAADHFARKWPTWSPASRRHSQADLARACVHLFRDGAPTLSVQQRVDADRYLRANLPIVPKPAAAYRRRLITWDPWDAVEWKLPAEEDPIDADLVMDPAQVFELADACGAIDRRYECFVLIQGVCGLRPGEARELRRKDFDLASRPAIVTVAGSYSDVGDRCFDRGESRRRPLKGRGARATRPIAIPEKLVARLQGHLDEFVGPEADALVFTTCAGARINLSRFSVNVWRPAREKLFADDSPLRNVRRHDLRHSAITTWLNRGVTLKTGRAQDGLSAPEHLPRRHA